MASRWWSSISGIIILDFPLQWLLMIDRIILVTWLGNSVIIGSCISFLLVLVDFDGYFLLFGYEVFIQLAIN